MGMGLSCLLCSHQHICPLPLLMMCLLLVLLTFLPLLPLHARCNLPLNRLAPSIRLGSRG